MLRGGGARRSPRRGAATASNRDEDKVSRANAPNQGTQLAGAKEAAPRVSDPEVAGGLVDAIRPMFPTLVGECQYPGFENEKTRLIECIYRVREDDVEGRERSRNDYNIGYTSFFSRTDLYNLPEFNPLAAFICGKGIEYAQFSEMGSAELRAPPDQPMGQHQPDLLLSFRSHPPVQPHQWSVLRQLHAGLRPDRVS